MLSFKSVEERFSVDAHRSEHDLGDSSLGGESRSCQLTTGAGEPLAEKHPQGAVAAVHTGPLGELDGGFVRQCDGAHPATEVVSQMGGGAVVLILIVVGNSAERVAVVNQIVCEDLAM